jgi:hypothetical protein
MPSRCTIRRLKGLVSATTGEVMNLGYIDAGTGSMLIQALIAGALAIPFFFRTNIARLTNRLRKKPEADESKDVTGR